MSPWIPLTIAALALVWPFWKLALAPLFPLEGMSKLLFVVACWYGGLMAAWASFNVRYWLPWIPVSLVLLAVGIQMAWAPIQRWRRDRILFGVSRPPTPVAWIEPENKREDQAA